MDSFSDSLGTVLHEISQKYNVPDFVKTAKRSDLCPEKPEGWSDEDFEASLSRVCADPMNLGYPCHTKAATWASAAYLMDEYETLQPYYRQQVGDRIEKFAEYFGIEDELRNLQNTKVAMLKQASEQQEFPDDWYAFVVNHDGNTQKSGLMVDELSMQKAAEWLISNRNELPLHQCTDVACRIFKRAAALSVAVPYEEQIERILGFGFNDNETIAEQLEKRAKSIKNSNRRDTLMKIASEFRSNPPEIGSETMYKVACFVDECDKQGGLMGQRMRHEIPLPEDIVYRHTLSEMRKVASDHIKLQNGGIYPVASLQNLDRNAFEDEFGTELAEECFSGLDVNMGKAAGVLPTLPRPQAERLSSMLSASGVRPVRREKASSAITIPPEYYN